MSAQCVSWLASMVFVGSGLAGGSTAFAQEAGADATLQLLDEVRSLRAEQAALTARIDELEAQLSEKAPQDSIDEVVRLRSNPDHATDAARAKFEVAGDLRLRWESNAQAGDVPVRNRATTRARLTFARPIGQDWRLVTRLATGAQDDPNSTDVTFGSFNDDLIISLDQLYAERRFGPVTVLLGKHPRPFMATDMVWDGDVSLQGAAFDLTAFEANEVDLGLRGAFFIIDENPSGDDSFMLGGQAYLNADFGNEARVEAAVGYYDYTLDSLINANGGDFRTNLLGPNGGYASDFNLIDSLAVLNVAGLGPSWPLRLSGNLVYNTGASTRADTGWLLGASAGQLNETGGLRLGYNYSDVEQDAVLAAFSNDNLAIASGYILHSLDGVYRFNRSTDLSLVAYVYRDERDLPRTELLGRGDWQTRVRANLLFRF